MLILVTYGLRNRLSCRLLCRLVQLRSDLILVASLIFKILLSEQNTINVMLKQINENVYYQNKMALK